MDKERIYFKDKTDISEGNKKYQDDPYGNDRGVPELSRLLIFLASVYSILINVVLFFVIMFSRLGDGSSGAGNVNLFGLFAAVILQCPSLLLLIYPFGKYKRATSPVYYCAYAGYTISVIMPIAL